MTKDTVRPAAARHFQAETAAAVRAVGQAHVPIVR